MRTSVRLDEVAEINPRCTLPKGTVSSYVSMSDLREHRRQIDRFGERGFTSGSKFANGDTLMARITPCLENGKTAFVDFLTDDEIAHGSTEFLVLRALPERVEPLFLYYLATSTAMRDYAVQRMTGTSGRQRVSAAEIGAYRFDLPPLEEQQAIVDELGTVDDRIEHLERVIASCYLLCDLLFEELSMNPEVTRIMLRDAASISKGISYKGEYLSDVPAGCKLINLGLFGRDRGPRLENVKHYLGPTKPRHHVTCRDVVVCATDMTSDRLVLGKAFVVPTELNGAAFTHHLFALHIDESTAVTPELVALALCHEPVRRRIANFANGTTVLALPPDAVLGVEVPVPPMGAAVVEEISLLFQMIWHSQSEMNALFKFKSELRSLRLGLNLEV